MAVTLISGRIVEGAKTRHYRFIRNAKEFKKRFPDGVFFHGPNDTWVEFTVSKRGALRVTWGEGGA